MSIKIVVVGDDECNKTQLLISYTTYAFPGEYIPTVFDNYTVNITVDDQDVVLNLWDTQGQDIYKKLRPLSYEKTQCFILVFSLVSPITLQNIENIWAPEIKEYCPGVPFILVGFNSSIRDDFSQNAEEYKSKGWEPIPKEKGEEMKNKIGALEYIECDALKKYHLKEVFDSAARAVIGPHNQENRKEKKKSIFHIFKRKKDKGNDSE